MDKKHSNLIILLLILGIFTSLFLVFFQKHLRKEERLASKERQASIIEIQDKDRLLSVDKGGQVKLKTPTEVFYQSWETDKTETFFQYIKNKIRFSKPVSESERQTDDFVVSLLIDGKWQSFTIDTGDELLNLVFEEVSGGYSSEEIAGGDIVDYFKQYSPSPQSDVSSPDDALQDDDMFQEDSSEDDFFQDTFLQDDSSQDSSSQDDSLTDSLCPYWRLSYCFYPQSSTPPPESVFWQGSTVVRAPDCDLWEKTITKRTVISNTVCIEEE